jgi:hypothetical protein
VVVPEPGSAPEQVLAWGLEQVRAQALVPVPVPERELVPEPVQALALVPARVLVPALALALVPEPVLAQEPHLLFRRRLGTT